MTTTTATEPAATPVAPAIAAVPRGAIDVGTPAGGSNSIWTGSRVIALVLTVVETLLLTRFAFSLFGANEGQPLVSFVKGMTGPLVAPFEGIFGQPPGVDVAAILAVVFFLLVGALIVAAVRAITGRCASPPPTD